MRDGWLMALRLRFDVRWRSQILYQGEADRFSKQRFRYKYHKICFFYLVHQWSDLSGCAEHKVQRLFFQIPAFSHFSPLDIPLNSVWGKCERANNGRIWKKTCQCKHSFTAHLMDLSTINGFNYECCCFHSWFIRLRVHPCCFKYVHDDQNQNKEDLRPHVLWIRPFSQILTVI